MPDIDSYWRTDCPPEGFYSAALPTAPDRPVRTFLPTGYERRYPYPLLVLFHPHGSTEERVLRMLPKASRRNFLGVSVRGSRAVERPDGRPGFGWATDGAELADDVLRAVEMTRRNYHVHTERVYLVGVQDGAAAAYRAAFALGGQVAGVAALNGAAAAVPGEPLFRLDRVRGLRVMIAHGVNNRQVPLGLACYDKARFFAAGADVTLGQYPTDHRVHAHMLRDLNRWVIGHVMAEQEVFARR
jgi:phospholipase/carboxylesterase